VKSAKRAWVQTAKLKTIQFLEDSRAHVRVHCDAFTSHDSAIRHFRGITKPLYDMGQGAILFRVTHHWNVSSTARSIQLRRSIKTAPGHNGGIV
jgi:hypothetical protein